MWRDLQVKYPFFGQNLMKLDFSLQIFEKNLSINFRENPSNGSRVVPCGQTDGHDVNDRFSQFW
jgi:hypothetical protein